MRKGNLTQPIFLTFTPFCQFLPLLRIFRGCATAFRNTALRTTSKANETCQAKTVNSADIFAEG